MLKDAVEAGLPLIVIAARDMINFETVVAHITGKPPLAYDGKDPAKSSLYYMNLKGKKAEGLKAIYSAMATAGSTLILVNIDKVPDEAFDAGDLETPKELVRKVLVKAFKGSGDKEAAETFVEGLMPALGGLTLKEVSEVLRLTQVRQSTINAEAVTKTRSLLVPNLSGLTQINTDLPVYLPNPVWDAFVKENKAFFVNETIDPRLVPRGVLLDGDPGTGKCLAPHEPVLLYDGTVVRTDYLLPGERLMGPDSLPRTVQSVTPGYGPMFEVRPVKGRAWQCNGDHILSLRRSKNPGAGEIVFVTVNEWLTWPGGRKDKYKLWRTGVEFPAQPSPVLDPYFVGVLLGDGSVHEGVQVTTVDPEIIACLHDEALAHGLKVVVYSYDDQRTPRYALSGGNTGQASNPIYKELLKLGGFEDGCAGKYVADPLKLGARSVRLQVLAGLLDTDGSYDDRGGVYDFVSKSARLAEDVAFISRSLGLAATLTPCEKTCTNTGATGSYWRVCISGILDGIPCRIPRKKARPRKANKNVLNVGFDIVPIGEGPWFGITLDGDRQYLLDDFTVTHNTQGAKHLARSWGVPLYRMDATFQSKWVGESEGNIQRILNQAAQEAPCILLLDEVEKIFSKGSISGAGGGSGVTSKAMSLLLWFMQENPARVFVIMTCNNKSIIPPELYREGRVAGTITFEGLKIEDAYVLADAIIASFKLGLDAKTKEAFVTDVKKGIHALFGGKDKVAHSAINEAVNRAIKALIMKQQAAA